MKHFVEQTSLKLNEIECDVCHKKFNINDDMFEVQEFVSISEIGGFSSVFGDENKIELDICQHCLKEKLGQFIRITQYE